VRYFDKPDAACCDEFGACLWQEVLHRIPDVKIAVIKRPLTEVIPAQIKNGAPDTPELRHMMARYRDDINQMLKVHRCEIFSFNNLSDYDESKRLFEFCREMEMPVKWWLMFENRNLQNPSNLWKEHLDKWIGYPVIKKLRSYSEEAV
jgi:hypothetical protein